MSWRRAGRWTAALALLLACNQAPKNDPAWSTYWQNPKGPPTGTRRVERGGASFLPRRGVTATIRYNHRRTSRSTSWAFAALRIPERVSASALEGAHHGDGVAQRTHVVGPDVVDSARDGPQLRRQGRRTALGHRAPGQRPEE